MEKTGKGHRIYLRVPYEEKEEAKQLGARWDPDRKQWYVPPAMTVNVSKKTSKLLSMWNIGGTGDEEHQAMTSENRRVYEKITTVLGTTAQSGNEGLDQILQMRVKKLCLRFLAENHAQTTRPQLVMLNCELTNLLYCMLLENEHLLAENRRLHARWMAEAQGNWAKL